MSEWITCCFSFWCCFLSLYFRALPPVEFCLFFFPFCNVQLLCFPALYLLCRGHFSFVLVEGIYWNCGLVGHGVLDNEVQTREVVRVVRLVMYFEGRASRFWISWILKCEGKNWVKCDVKILNMSLSGGVEKITEGISWATSEGMVFESKV